MQEREPYGLTFSVVSVSVQASRIPVPVSMISGRGKPTVTKTSSLSSPQKAKYPKITEPTQGSSQE